MQLECEVRFLDIDLPELEERLHALGLVPEYQTLFRITIFHGLSGEDREYIRVRDEGHRITMTHKRTFQDSLIAQEREVLVDSYENAIGFLEGIGLKHKRTEEKYRVRYRYGTARIDLDTWPGIPTYVEIETDSLNNLAHVCEKLGFTIEQGYGGDAHDVFRYYGINPREVPLLVFSEDEKEQLKLMEFRDE